MSKPRARSWSGRLIHFRVNPERIPVVCQVCGRTTMKRASTIRPGTVIVTCSRLCRDLMASLWPLKGRIAMPSTSAPAAAIDAEIAPPSTSRLH
jgi:hypothetical protein